MQFRNSREFPELPEFQLAPLMPASLPPSCSGGAACTQNSNEMLPLRQAFRPAFNKVACVENERRQIAAAATTGGGGAAQTFILARVCM